MSRRTAAAAAVAGVVLVTGGGVAYAQAQGSTGSYRTAIVTTGDVDQTLGLSGTISASARQDLSFGTSGTVAKVEVSAGDTVRSGATLARLDRTALQAAVTKAKADLAKARAQLESDETSQASTVTAAVTPSAATGQSGSSSGSSSPSGSTSTKESSGTSRALKAALAKLTVQQKAVSTNATAASDAVAAAKTALADQIDRCKAPDAGVAAPAALSEECADALAEVEAAQDVVAQKQDALQTALESLSKTLSGAVAAVQKSSRAAAPSSSQSSSTTTQESSGSSASTSASTSASRTSGSSSAGGTVTAATLAQDQASIDTAKASRTEAGRALDAATLSAPFAGHVLSVSAAKGDVVGESDVEVVIVGNGGTTATTTVTSDQISDVRKGQTAEVTPAGASRPVSGTVTSIGLLPTSGSDPTTYPVTIDLDADVAAPEGSTAVISVVIGTAAKVLTIPSSAVSTARRTTVKVLTDGKPVVTPVEVGVVGHVRTEITSGLKRGQEIVVADLDTDLPSGDAATTRLPGTGGGFRDGGGAGGRPAGAQGGGG